MSLFTHLKQGSRSLSWRLLSLTLLWVFLITLAMGYTFKLGWQTQDHFNILRQVISVRGDIFRVNLFIDETFTLADFNGEISRVDSEIKQIRKEIVVADFAQKDLLIERANKISDIWFKYLRGEMVEAKKVAIPLDAEKIGFVIPFVREFRIILEDVHDREVSRIQMIQVVLLSMSLLSLFFILVLLYRWVVKPTGELQEALDRLTRGDFSVRLAFKNSNEFEGISAGFNRMSKRLEELVSDLEAKAQEKTFAVEERNRNLSQLYELTSYLGKNQSITEMCESFTLRMMHYTGAVATAVFLLDSKTQKLTLAASVDLPEAVVDKFKNASMDYEDLGERKDLHSGFVVPYLENGIYALFSIDPSVYQTVYCFHVRTGADTVGLYLLYYKKEVQLSARRNQLYENFGTHLAVGIGTQRLIARDRQLAVMQERGFLARGLHDSIAQALSFLNLQVQLLETGLKGKDEALVAESLAQIKTGVQESYADVRELLTNFRERLHQETFQEALQSALDRFTMQTHIKVKYTMRGSVPPFSEQQKLQIIFILQEALANVRKHAEAGEVTVITEYNKNFILTVNDNGIGMDYELMRERKASHFGLTIMKERADRIGGTVTFDTVSKGLYPTGTAVTLMIPAHVLTRVH